MDSISKAPKIVQNVVTIETTPLLNVGFGIQGIRRELHVIQIFY